NMDLQRLLLSRGLETDYDRTRLKRLKERAAQGNSAAKKLLAFDNTGDRKHLQGLKLDDILEIVAPQAKSSAAKKTGPGPSPVVTGVADMLNSTGGLEAAAITQVLEDLAGDWPLE